MSILKEDEEQLLMDICKKHNIRYHQLIQLFKIEKRYADRNLSRRKGIYTDINELITRWAKVERDRNEI